MGFGAWPGLPCRRRRDRLVGCPGGAASHRDGGRTWTRGRFGIRNCVDPWMAITGSGEAMFLSVGQHPGCGAGRGGRRASASRSGDRSHAPAREVATAVGGSDRRDSRGRSAVEESAPMTPAAGLGAPCPRPPRTPRGVHRPPDARLGARRNPSTPPQLGRSDRMFILSTTPNLGASQTMASTLGRNDPCDCGSGKKYKHCCQGKDRSTTPVTSKTTMIVIAAVVLVGLVLMVISLTVGGGEGACPPGTTWSAAHGHCH